MKSAKYAYYCSPVSRHGVRTWFYALSLTIMKYFLVTTSHLSDGIWFKDDEDFKAGMNYVAIMASKGKAFVLCFVLMSNHVHFVLGCESKEEAWGFITGYKQLYARYFYIKYGVRKFLRRNGVDIRELFIQDESLHKGIAYTAMNPVAANICAHASQYAWGSGNCYFKIAPTVGTRIGMLSARKQQKVLRSYSVINQDYLLDTSGYILPDSYVCKDFVQKLFCAPGRLNYFLNNSSKVKARFESEGNLVPTFRDQVVVSMIPEICRTLFQKRREELQEREKGRLIYELNHRFNCDPKQIARLTGYDYKYVAESLVSF